MDLRKSAVYISIINAIGIILGLIFHILLGRKFGISRELDCLFISLLIFGFFGIFNALITSLFMPVFIEIKTINEKEGYVFADVILKWSLLIGLIIYLFIVNFGSFITRLFAPGFNVSSIDLSTELLKILFIGYIFNNLTVSVGIILNSLYLFMMPALTSLLNPVINLSAIFILTPQYGVGGIAISYLISNVLHAFILIAYLFIKTPWRPTLTIYHKRLPELLRQSSKATLSNFIWNLREVISRNIASHLGSGSISLISYADKIISILSQIAISPVSTVFYPKVSELVAMTKWSNIRDLLLRTARINIMVSVFASAAVVVFARPLLNLLFLGSKFNENDIHILFYLMAIELFFIVILSFETLLVKIIYSVKDINIILSITIAGVVLFYIISTTFSMTFGIYGLALSVSITQFPICFFYFYFTNRYVNTKLDSILYPLLKNLILTLLFITTGLFVNSNVNKDTSIIFVWFPLWVLLYIAVSKYVLKSEWDILRNKKI